MGQCPKAPPLTSSLPIFFFNNKQHRPLPWQRNTGTPPPSQDKPTASPSSRRSDRPSSPPSSPSRRTTPPPPPSSSVADTLRKKMERRRPSSPPRPTTDRSSSSGSPSTSSSSSSSSTTPLPPNPPPRGFSARQLALRQRLTGSTPPSTPSSSSSSPPSSSSSSSSSSSKSPKSVKELKALKAQVDWVLMSKEKLLDQATFDKIRSSVSPELSPHLHDGSLPLVTLLTRMDLSPADLSRIHRSSDRFFQQSAISVKNKIRQLKEELGFTDAHIKALLLGVPRIFCYKTLHNIGQHFAFYLQYGFVRDELHKMIYKSPVLLDLSIEQNLKAKLTWLEGRGSSGSSESGGESGGDGSSESGGKEEEGERVDASANHVDAVEIGLGLRREQIRLAAMRLPSLLTYSIPQMKSRVAYLLRLGLSLDQVAAGVVRHPQLLHYATLSMEKRITWLRDGLGLSREECAQVVGRFFQIFSCDVDGNLQPKVEYLRREMGIDVAPYVTKTPAVLSLSLQGRIIPRHRFYLLHGVNNNGSGGGGETTTASSSSSSSSSNAAASSSTPASSSSSSSTVSVASSSFSLSSSQLMLCTNETFAMRLGRPLVEYEAFADEVLRKLGGEPRRRKEEEEESGDKME